MLRFFFFKTWVLGFELGSSCLKHFTTEPSPLWECLCTLIKNNRQWIIFKHSLSGDNKEELLRRDAEILKHSQVLHSLHSLYPVHFIQRQHGLSVCLFFFERIFQDSWKLNSPRLVEIKGSTQGPNYYCKYVVRI